ncbi:MULTISPECIES: PLDc N-terminal domain-containing protein [Arthrobacter]|uniref:PLDc N-terminal domain-containing protein n=2 Tax=Arthrobacter TaxID=1663 RepID=A0ABU9KKV0_9MICC|nr:PLDc N-terminal domain-containing protein [Arthrobacter sp. YJM1]MDP5227529.1 PLDc N-terminal domain-containing protein [Arthrobacter sp. YJM1]
MPRVIITVLLVAVWIYAIIDCIRSEPDEVRGVPKGVWIVVLILLPLIGAVLWFALGRPRISAASAGGRPAQNRGPAAGSGPVGPDDDPQFLRNLEQQRRNQAEAKRLEDLRRELEQRERENKERRPRDGEDGAPGENGPGQNGTGPHQDGPHRNS